MRKIVISLVLLLSAAGALLLRSRTVDPTTLAIKPEAAEAVPTSGEFKKAGTSAQIELDIGMQERISQLRILSKKALLSKDEQQSLVVLLSDGRLQEQIFETLSAGDSILFNAEQERDRMEMVGLLNLIVKQKAVQGREAVIDRAVERVTSLNFKAIKDQKQKQSIFGDTVEIIQILKHSEPDAYETVKSAITRQEQKALTRALVVAG